MGKGAPHGRERILVVDDDDAILHLIEANLRLDGFDVVRASDGEQALALAVAERPALILLDVMMPRLDGVEVCRRLRTAPATRHIPVLMLTALGLSSDCVEGLSSGADDYILKPFDTRELLARVRATLRRAQELSARSPLTNLPGNIAIEHELTERIHRRDPIALGYVDLDHFKSFNDRYGFARGDDVLRATATILSARVWEISDGFLGHVGGDDFVFVVHPAAAARICRNSIRLFDTTIRSFYDPLDAARASIALPDRRGAKRDFPLMSMSIGVATTRHRSIADFRELVDAATQMKAWAKERAGSVYGIDRRVEPASAPSGVAG